MKFTFLEGENKKLSTLVKTEQANFLFGCQKGIFTNLSDGIDFIILSNSDEESLSGYNELINWIAKSNSFDVPIYAPENVHDLIKEKMSLAGVEQVVIKPNTKFKLRDTNIELSSFPVGKGLGYRFDNVVYVPAGEIPIGSDSYLYSARTIISSVSSKELLDLSTRYKPTGILFTSQDGTYDELRAKWKDLRGFSATEFVLAKQDSVLEIGREFSQMLMEQKKTIALADTKCGDIRTGLKTLIVMGALCRDYINVTTYLTGYDTCYGVIRLGRPYKIDGDDFEELKEKHRISKEERTKWWGQKEILFAYPFEIVDLFKVPKQVKLNENNEIVDFISDEDESSSEWGNLSIINQFENAMVIKDFICASGEYVDQKEGVIPEKLSISIKMNEPNKLIKQMIESQISSSLSQFKENIEFLWGESNSRTAFIPLYDLKLERILPAKRVTLKEEELKPVVFEPFKPNNEVNDIEKLKAVIGDSRYAVEKNYQGVRALLFKLSENVMIYNGTKEEVTKSYPELVKQALELTGKDFIIDGVIVGGEDKKYFVFDCLRFGSEDLREEQWIARKAALRNLSFTDNIKEAQTTIVEGKYGVEKAIQIINTIPNSNGAVIKSYSGTYNSKDAEWTTFKTNRMVAGATTTSTPGIAGTQGSYVEDEIKKKEKKKEMSTSNIEKHDYFSKWSSNMAYFLGLLSTDGHLDNPSNRIEFMMGQEDGAILKVLAKELGDPKGPSVISGYSAYRFKSQEMADDLRKLGMDIKKKHRITHNKVPSQYKWDFARGAFDGDGTITEDRIQFDTENKGLVHWMEGMFKKVTSEVKYYDYGNMGKVVVMRKAAEAVRKKIYSGGGPRFARKNAKSVKKMEAEIEVENIVVKKGDQYCVVHGHPQKPGSKTDKPEGSVIKCFSTKAEADAMHKAIIISQIKNK